MRQAADSARFRQSLLKLLEASPHEDEALLAGIERLGRSGRPLYSTVLHVLTHLSFTEPQARRHWERILEHRREVGARLGRDPGLRVAILDYFVNVNHELKSPKVVEIAIFERTERRALTDGLTGLFNRAYFTQALRREMQRARRHHKGMAFLMIDIDHFKHINDTYGHLQGDTVLSELAKILASGKREYDVCARYGGEEFGLILHETNEIGAMTLAERIRAKVEAATFPGNLKVTISVGVAATEDEERFTSLIERADQALYAAKQAGRNTVRSADMREVAARRE